MATIAPIGTQETQALKAGIRLATRLESSPPSWRGGEGGVAIQSSDAVFGMACAARIGPPDRVIGADSSPASDRLSPASNIAARPFGLFGPVI